VQANAPAAAPETAPSDSAATTKTALLKANGNKQLANK
jgi:hypothetical protein